MHRHEMQQSNVYLGIYTIVYYFLLLKSGCYSGGGYYSDREQLF
jgi:hypothetical protein